MRTAFFTICTNSYIAYARILMDDIARHHPGASRYVVLADEPHIDLSDDNFEVILARDLGIPTFESLTFRYSVTELCTALKPHAFLELFRRGAEICLYLDPDISIFLPLTEALTAVTDGQAALTPHRLGPQTTTGWPDDRQLLQVGAYNLGFVALRHTPEVAERVTWWARQLEHGCVVNLPEGLFVDQKWMDLWPSFCSGTVILRHPGYNVAYWNLAERKVEKRGNGFEVNGVPLVFFHFSGVMPDRRDLLSKYRQVFTGANIGDANELLQAYIAELQRKGFDEQKALPCAYSLFDNGVLIPPFGRSLYRRNEGAFPDPRHAVFQALQAPASGAAGAELTVAAVELWELRKDLQAAFDIDTPEGQHGFRTLVRRQRAPRRRRLDLREAGRRPHGAQRQFRSCSQFRSDDGAAGGGCLCAVRTAATDVAPAADGFPRVYAQDGLQDRLCDRQQRCRYAQVARRRVAHRSPEGGLRRRAGNAQPCGNMSRRQDPVRGQ